MNLIGYIRVSRRAGREGPSYISPAVQRERIEHQAAAAGHTVVGWQEDEDQPGSRYQREGFQAALEAVERGEADGIIVAALDRFARKISDALVALRRLDEAGGTLVSARELLDTSTPMGRFARTVMLALAEMELERIGENWAVARERAVERGVHICRVPPVGYQRDPDGDSVLELDPDTAPTVREIFRRRGAGESWRAICQFLDASLPRENGGSWTHQTVSSIVANRVYLGEARQGELLNVAAHEPLIPRAEWEAAQVTLTRAATSKGGALLAGILRCSGCGFTLTRTSDGKRGYDNYRCARRHSAGVCPAPARLSVKRADSYVEGLFLDSLRNEGIAVQASERNEALAAALRRLEAAEAELQAYMDADLLTVVGADAFRAGAETRQGAIDKARRELADARRATVPLPLGPKQLLDVWPTLDTDQRRTILSAAFDAVAVQQSHLPGQGSAVADRVHVYWRGDAPLDLPGRGSGSLRPLPLRNRPRKLRVARTHKRKERPLDRAAR